MIVGTIRVPVEKLEAARPAMKRVVEGSRAEAGCEEYSYAEDLVEPGRIHIVERWQDQASLDRHFLTPHIKEWRTAGAELGVHGRNLLLYEVQEGRSI